MFKDKTVKHVLMYLVYNRHVCSLNYIHLSWLWNFTHQATGSTFPGPSGICAGLS